MNLTLYDDERLSAEAFCMLQRRHSQRDELRSSLGQLRFIVDREDADTLIQIQEIKSLFATTTAIADTTPPQWSYWSKRAEEYVNYNLSDNILIEEEWRAFGGEGYEGGGIVSLAEGRYTVDLGRMVQLTRGKENKPKAIKRTAPYLSLLELVDHPAKGISSLCYHRLNDRVCEETGRVIDRNDDEGWEAHQEAVAAARAAGTPLEKWRPTVDNLEGGNQAMMVAEGMHTAVLKWLQAKKLDAGKVKEMADDPNKVDTLRLVASCYRLLYYICWDHPENWVHFSTAPILRFLFSQLDELAEVFIDGERLNSWVAKLLEEIIVDNDEANRKLSGHNVTQVVQRLVLDGLQPESRVEGDTAGGWRGRTQYVNILKAIVEDDVQVTWVPPHTPSRHSLI